MKAADTSASIATAAWTPLTVVSRSCTTAEMDTFMNDVSMTNTNIAAARKTPISRLPFAFSSGSMPTPSTGDDPLPAMASVRGWQSGRVGRTQYYTATTLDGFIADEHDSLDWLFEVDRE